LLWANSLPLCTELGHRHAQPDMDTVLCQCARVGLASLSGKRLAISRM